MINMHRERELLDQVNRLQRELGKAEGELGALKAQRPRLWWSRHGTGFNSFCAVRQFEVVDDPLVFETYSRERAANHPFDPILFLRLVHYAT